VILEADSCVSGEWELAREDVTILENLGHGFFGTVYRGVLRDALDPSVKHTVAVKVKHSVNVSCTHYEALFVNKCVH